MAMLKLKRAYEKPSRGDGARILVKRLWPRGLTKECAAVDLWLKEVAPSQELRKWFGHDPARWGELPKWHLLGLQDGSAKRMPAGGGSIAAVCVRAMQRNSFSVGAVRAVGQSDATPTCKLLWCQKRIPAGHWRILHIGTPPLFSAFRSQKPSFVHRNGRQE
jgi:uncharacterized protein YeaO (DUF488 family)